MSHANLLSIPTLKPFVGPLVVEDIGVAERHVPVVESNSRRERKWNGEKDNEGNEKHCLTHLWFYNLQISDLYARGRKIWNLEFDTDWSFALFALACAAHASAESTGHPSAKLIIPFDRGKIELCAHEEFFAASELLDLPYDSTFLRSIMYSANVCSKSWGVGVVGDRDQDLDIVGCAPALELCFGLIRQSAGDHRTLASAGDHTLSMYSIREPEWDSTTGSTQIRGLTCVLSR